MIVKTEYEALQQLIEYDFIYGGNENMIALSVFSKNDTLWGLYSCLTIDFEYIHSEPFIVTDPKIIALSVMKKEHGRGGFVDIVLTPCCNFRALYKLDDLMAIDAGIFDLNAKMVFDKAS